MAAGEASISGLGSALRSDCEAGLPTETGSGLLRRKVPSARGAAWGRAICSCVCRNPHPFYLADRIA